MLIVTGMDSIIPIRPKLRIYIWDAESRRPRLNLHMWEYAKLIKPE